MCVVGSIHTLPLGKEKKRLTVSWNDAQRHRVSRLFDQVDDVRVGLVGDGAAVDGEDAVSHLQLSAAVRRTALDDPPYFMRHCHTCVSSFFAFAKW